MATKRHRFAQRRKSLGLTQEALADRLRVERSTVRRWESGESDPLPWARPAIAKAPDLSLGQLDALLHETVVSGAAHLVEYLGTADAAARVQPRGLRVDRPGQSWPDRDLSLTIMHLGQPDLPEIDDMNRRELLRLFSMTGALLALPPLDTDRIVHAARNTATRLDVATTNEYAQLNTSLWRVFTFAPSKSQVLPLVRKQLDVLTEKLTEPHEQEVHRRQQVVWTAA